MKKYQIVVDSSSDMLSSHFNDENILFSIIPLTIKVDEKEYIDNDELNPKELLEAVNSFSGASTSSCPSLGLFEETYSKAENTVCITISSKLSGTYNGARLSADQIDKTKHNVVVFDSKLTSGGIQLAAEKCYELMKQDLSIEDITKQLNEFIDSLTLYFVLDRFDNLIKNGRVSKISGIIAGILNIKPIAMGENGEIKLNEKKRTAKAALKRVIELIGTKGTDFSDRNLLINHVFADETAQWIKEELENSYNFKSIRIVPTRGLCTFYALDNGIIISY